MKAGIKFSKRLFLACWLACNLFVSIGLSAADLHLFLVGDYESTELMPALKYDIANIRKEARQISDYTGLKVRETVLTGPAARTSEVLTKLKALKSGPEDVIIFYFTGHGFRTGLKGDNPWPYLFFATEHKGIDFAQVAEIITEKKSRLRILVVDGCNNVISNTAVRIVKDPVQGSRTQQRVKDNYRELFLNARGTIIAAACEAGETSLALSTGSLYTLSFLEILHEEVKKSGDLVDWQGIMDLTKIKSEGWAARLDEIQNPIFVIMP